MSPAESAATHRQPPRDQFELLCRQAAGLPIPPLPDIPGRAYTQPMSPKAEPDAFAEAWDLRTGTTTTDGSILSCRTTPTPAPNPETQQTQDASNNAALPAGAPQV